jgi:hypothetical protein
MTHLLLLLVIPWLLGVCPCAGVTEEAAAHSPERTITFCSQNLENFGTYAATLSRMPQMTPERYEVKKNGLVARILEAGCDIVAVQEVVGHGQRQAERGLEVLIENLNSASSRRYRGVLTPSEDPDSRVGFFYDDQVQRLEKVVSLTWEEMPTLDYHYRPQRYSRGPLVGTFVPTVSPRYRIVVMVLHLKSKRGSQGDPAKLQFEPLRMQMAAGIVDQLKARVPEAFIDGSKELLVVAGDRNSEPTSGSARILAGALSLEDFRRGGPCIVLRSGEPSCDPEPVHHPMLYSVLPDGRDSRDGSFRYKGTASWIDTIMVPYATLRHVGGKVAGAAEAAGRVTWNHPAASDHGMVSVEFRLPAQSETSH